MPIIVIVCVVIVLGGLGVWHADQGGVVPSPSPKPSRYTRPTPSPRSSVRLDVHWLQAVKDYSLFVHTDGAVYRIDAKSGRAVRIRVPPVNEPATVLPIDHGVLIRPAQSTEVYRVPDEGPVHSFEAPGTQLLPGPDPGNVWVRRDQTHLALMSLNGLPTPTQLELPASTVGDPYPDGHGYIVVQTTDGVYDVRPDRTTRLVTGQLLAVGQNRLLVAHCKGHTACQAVVLGPDLTPIRTLSTLDVKGLAGHGVISPDGRYAALAAPTDPSDNPITLVDLSTGATRRLFATVGWQIQVPGSGQLAFSPNGQWLFVIGSDADVEAVNISCAPADGSCVSSRTLPDLGTARQVAVRAGT